MTLVVGAWGTCAGVWDLAAADLQRRKASVSDCEYQDRARHPCVFSNVHSRLLLF